MLEIPRTGKNPGILEFLHGTFDELPDDAQPKRDMLSARIKATAPGVGEIAIDDIAADLRGLRIPQDYSRLIRHVPEPAHLEGQGMAIDDWNSDAQFALQRVAGPNPVVIRVVDAAGLASLRSKMDLDDAWLAPIFGPDAPTIEQAVDKGLLFVNDYCMLAEPAPLPCGAGRFLPTPIGLFTTHPGTGQLFPVAVHPSQERGARTEVPANGSEAWAVAKTMLRVADFNHHEMSTHLGLTHFVQEGMLVATRRSLAPQHPVAALLAPHFECLVFNNFAGRELLVQPGGYVSKILSGELDAGSLEIVRRSYEGFRFDDLDLPASLGARGVMNRGTLPGYPYRDDGLDVWSAQDTFVRRYLAAWYADDATVAQDVELAAWAAEMTSADAAHLNGFPEAFDTIDRLARTLTRILFLAGPHHAAVNYPQGSEMMMVPNMPAASWAEAPDDLMSMLPELDPADAQIQIIWSLTCYKYGTLGQYGTMLPDARVQPAIADFQANLAQVEERIASRNTYDRSGHPYGYLLPSRIPNSTNI